MNFNAVCSAASVSISLLLFFLLPYLTSFRITHPSIPSYVFFPTFFLLTLSYLPFFFSLSRFKVAWMAMQGCRLRWHEIWLPFFMYIKILFPAATYWISLNENIKKILHRLLLLQRLGVFLKWLIWLVPRLIRCIFR